MSCASLGKADESGGGEGEMGGGAMRGGIAAGGPSVVAF